MSKKDLPMPQKNTIRAKFRRAMLILLSAVGLASNITATTQANTSKQEIETEKYDTKKDEFINNLKVNIAHSNEDIVKGLLEDRKERGLGEYSRDTGCGDKVKQILINTLDKIDENYDMNASKRGILAIRKKEYKNNIYSLIKNLDDIVVLDEHSKEENQYTKYFENRKSVGAFYTMNDIENELGVIPKNIVVMKPSNDLEDLRFNFIHELAHSEQGRRKKSLCVQSADVGKEIFEGDSDNKAEYGRGIVLVGESSSNTVTDISLSGPQYKIGDIIRNKLGYLIGEKEMRDFIKKPDTDIYAFLENKLDSKYGKGTALDMYKSITHLSLYFNTYSGDLDENKKENIYATIEENNREIMNRISRGDNKSVLNDMYEVNNYCKQSLDNLSVSTVKEQRHKELEKLEKLTLKCIEKDIERISNKNEALDYIQLWDYYRNRCAIPKSCVPGTEEVSLSDNFKLLSKIQHKLYNKCKQYKALNIKNEDVFNALLESQVYSVKDARVRTNAKNTKLIISDQYLINRFDIIKEKDGNIKYSSGDEDYKRNTKNEAIGEIILAGKDREYIKD